MNTQPANALTTAFTPRGADLIPWRFDWSYPPSMVASLLRVTPRDVRDWMEADEIAYVPGSRTASRRAEVLHVGLADLVTAAACFFPAEGALRRAERDAAAAGLIPPLPHPWPRQLIARALGMDPVLVDRWTRMGLKDERDGRINLKKLTSFVSRTPPWGDLFWWVFQLDGLASTAFAAVNDRPY